MRYSRLTAIPALLLASPAFAAGAMPQLDPTWFASQLFWLAVSFLLLYALVSALIAPSVEGVFQERETAINDAIALAESLKKEAATTRGGFEQESAAARAQAAQIIAEAQAEMAKQAAAAHEKLAAELEKKLAAGEAELGQAMARAESSLEAAALPLAQSMVEKLLGSTVDEAAVRAAIGNLAKAA
jgi:F-type H+-transporting ATPase subunit b